MDREPRVEEVLLWTDIEELFQQQAAIVSIVLNAESVARQTTSYAVLVGRLELPDPAAEPFALVLARGQFFGKHTESTFVLLEMGDGSEGIVVEPTVSLLLASDLPEADDEIIEDFRALLRLAEWDATLTQQRADRFQAFSQAVLAEIESAAGVATEAN